MFRIPTESVDRSIVKRLVMCTSYGASWQSKNEYVSEELDELYKQDEDFDPSLTEKRLVTDAAILGQQIAFPQCDILNKFFRDVGKGCMDQGLEFVHWTTPNGSVIKQEYRWPQVKKVATRAMGAGTYALTTPTKDDEGRMHLSVQTGWGDVRTGKASTALGANWTHSVDATILQDTINRMPNEAFFTVHDCFYSVAGDMDEICSTAREAFLSAVTCNPLQDLLDSNNLDELSLPPLGKVDLSNIADAQYMFC